MDIINIIKNTGETNPLVIRDILYKKGILSSYDADYERLVCHTSINNRFNTYFINYINNNIYQ